MGTSKWSQLLSSMLSQKIALSLAGLILISGMAACDKSGGGVAILSAEESFKVSITTQPRPVDIMWVIDNSGSMESSQINLQTNFNSFIQDFITLNYDFRMVTTTTDSWFSQYNAGSLYSPRWRTGNRTNPNPTNSGVFVMDKNTPTLNSVFTTNAGVGINGNGDERAFASFVRSLNFATNVDFRRSSAFLAIIIVSDEEDFSSSNSSFNEDYANSNLRPVSYYVNWLDTYTGSNATNRNDKYQVSAIYIKDAGCLATLGDSSQKISTRYGELSDATGGVKASLCDPFNTVLDSIKTKILVASAVFQLDREPQPSSINVKVNGVQLNESSTTWSYDSVANAIRFAPEAVPSADDSISITYDPLTLL
jgi:hypothetical protein